MGDGDIDLKRYLYPFPHPTNDWRDRDKVEYSVFDIDFAIEKFDIDFVIEMLDIDVVIDEICWVKLGE